MRALRRFIALAFLTPGLCLAGVQTATYINGQGFNNLQAPATCGSNGQLLSSNGDCTSSWATGAVGTITGVTAGTGMSGGGSSGAVTLTNAGVVSLSSGTGISLSGATGAVTVSTLISTYAVTAAGTAYSFTASSATLDFGTTDPTLTLTQAGTYLILARVNAEYNGATFAASRTLTLKLVRTNNTAADIVTTAMSTRITTTVTDVFGVIDLPMTIYTTTNTNDALAVTGFLSVVPTAGSLDATESNIVAIRLF